MLHWVEQCALQFTSFLEPQNVSLFEHSIFADLISKEKVIASRVAPKSNMTGVLIKEEDEA